MAFDANGLLVVVSSTWDGSAFTPYVTRFDAAYAPAHERRDGHTAPSGLGRTAGGALRMATAMASDAAQGYWHTLDGSADVAFAIPGAGDVKSIFMAPQGDAVVVLRGSELWLVPFGGRAAPGCHPAHVVRLGSEGTAAFVGWTSSVVAIADRHAVEGYSRAAPYGRVFRLEVSDVAPAERTLVFLAGVNERLVIVTNTGLTVLDSAGTAVAALDPAPCPLLRSIEEAELAPGGIVAVRAVGPYALLFQSNSSSYRRLEPSFEPRRGYRVPQPAPPRSTREPSTVAPPQSSAAAKERGSVSRHRAR